MAKHEHSILQTIKLVQNRLEEIYKTKSWENSVTIQGKLKLYKRLLRDLAKFYQNC